MSKEYNKKLFKIAEKFLKKADFSYDVLEGGLFRIVLDHDGPCGSQCMFVDVGGVFIAFEFLSQLEADVSNSNQFYMLCYYCNLVNSVLRFGKFSVSQKGSIVFEAMNCYYKVLPKIADIEEFYGACITFLLQYIDGIGNIIKHNADPLEEFEKYNK
jgi:hypothetical protein